MHDSRGELERLAELTAGAPQFRLVQGILGCFLVYLVLHDFLLIPAHKSARRSDTSVDAVTGELSLPDISSVVHHSSRGTLHKANRQAANSRGGFCSIACCDSPFLTFGLFCTSRSLRSNSEDQWLYVVFLCWSGEQPKICPEIAAGDRAEATATVRRLAVVVNVSSVIRSCMPLVIVMSGPTA
jgi:hypothetical protein